ncbi:hypothetical protein TNCV_2449371 [Trichonephila clavipes]|nr:hypothetical protein TNCV_2449371 [Trichonephila clavipes]
MKIAGSIKINGNCPSKMKLYEDIESKLTVEFTKTHVRQGIDLGRMKITREEKEDRSWRRSISRLITKKEIQVEAYKKVRILLVETDEAAFDIMLKGALKMFDEKEEMKEFKRYFE